VIKESAQQIPVRFEREGYELQEVAILRKDWVENAGLQLDIKMIPLDGGAVVTGNVRSTSGSDARQDAGPIMDSVLSALMGWKPSPVHGELQLQTPPAPIFSNGFGYFPIDFQTRMTITGAA
ncbi:MAG: hypothetical protein ABFS30_10225, partial [Pseudomonadota bacterium]